MLGAAVIFLGVTLLITAGVASGIAPAVGDSVERTEAPADTERLQSELNSEQEHTKLDNGTLTISIANLDSEYDDDLSLGFKTADDSTDREIVPEHEAVEVEIDDLREDINIFEPFDIVAFPDTDENQTLVESLEIKALVNEPRLTADRNEGELLFESPFLFTGEEYHVMIGNRQESVNATEDRSLNLSDHNAFVLLSGNETLEISATGGDFETELAVPFDNDEVFGLAKDIADAPSVVPKDGEIRIEHDLLFRNESYELRIETSSPDGIFVKEVRATDQSVALPTEVSSALVADNFSTTATSVEGVVSGEDIFEHDTHIHLDEYTATIEGGNLTIEGFDSPEFVHQAWIKHNGQISLADATNQSVLSIDLTDSSISPEEEDTVDVVIIGEEGHLSSIIVEIIDVPTEDGGLFDGISRFLTIWLVAAVLSLLAFFLFFNTGPRSVRQALKSGKAFTVLVAGHALLFSLFVYLLFVLVEFSVVKITIATIAVTAVSGMAYGLDRQEQRDSRALVLAVAIAIMTLGISLIVYELVGWPVLWIVPGAAYGLFAAATLIIWYEYHASPASQQSRPSQNSPGPSTVEVTVEVVDEVSGQQIGSGVSVYAQQKKSQGLGPNQTDKQLKLNQGTAVEKLNQGLWEFEAQAGDRTDSKTYQIDQRRQSVRLAIPGTNFTVAIENRDGKPIPNADVSIGGNGFTDSGSTGRNGRFTSLVPFSADTVDITADHQLFEAKSQTAQVTAGGTKLALEPKQGQLTVTALLDREPVSDVSVTAERRTEPRLEESGTTDENGTVEFSKMLVGRYDIDAQLPVNSTGFSITAGEAVIEEGQTDRQEIRISFDFQLSREQKQRIRDLRGVLQTISRSSRRDDAVQHFYASVLHTALDEVECVPQFGYHFLRYNQNPDAVVDAVLEAIEEATEMMDEVLSSQRNVNLFSACSDLPSTTVEYDTDTGISSLLRMGSQGIGQQRSEVQREVEAIDDRITTELRDLSEVSPVREMWEGISEILRDQSGQSETEVAASNFVALLLLDAIESIFEHRDLRKRLEQTVY